VNQLYENQLVRKGDACTTELHFRNINHLMQMSVPETKEDVTSKDADSGKVVN
jgi:hypothetical protein